MCVCLSICLCICLSVCLRLNVVFALRLHVAFAFRFFHCLRGIVWMHVKNIKLELAKHQARYAIMQVSAHLVCECRTACAPVCICEHAVQREFDRLVIRSD